MGIPWFYTGEMFAAHTLAFTCTFGPTEPSDLTLG